MALSPCCCTAPPLSVPRIRTQSTGWCQPSTVRSQIGSVHEGAWAMQLVPESCRLADVIAQEFAGTGLRWAFGHPGGEVTVLIDALNRAGIRFVLTHHENTAAFIAGAYGEMTRRPGLCLATLGPGAATLATNSMRGTTHQHLDLQSLYTPITKASIQVTAENAGSAVRRAIAASTSTRMGPVHLSIPADVAASIVT